MAGFFLSNEDHINIHLPVEKFVFLWINVSWCKLMQDWETDGFSLFLLAMSRRERQSVLSLLLQFNIVNLVNRSCVIGFQSSSGSGKRSFTRCTCWRIYGVPIWACMYWDNCVYHLRFWVSKIGVDQGRGSINSFEIKKQRNNNVCNFISPR